MCKACHLTKKKQTARKTVERYDIKLNGKAHTVRVTKAVWNAFRKEAKRRKMSLAKLALEVSRKSNGSLSDAITRAVQPDINKPLPIYPTREDWLNAAVELLRPIAEERGYEIPEKVRVSVGFPSSNGLGRKKRSIGECWPRAASADGYNEIFISPLLGKPVNVFDTLVHEICHAIDDCQNGHKKPFARIGAAMDLEGKPTHMVGCENPSWQAWALPMIESLGTLPSAAMTPAVKEKKQTTRMIKCECPECGIKFRMAAKHIEACNDEPVCPNAECQTIMGIEYPEEGEA